MAAIAANTSVAATGLDILPFSPLAERLLKQLGRTKPKPEPGFVRAGEVIINIKTA